MKKTICLDFDGVCNTYTGWEGEDELFLPRDGLFEFILSLHENNKKIAIFSTRPADKLKKWFINYFKDPAVSLIELGDLYFPDKKPPAECYIDDRGITFNGSFNGSLLTEVLNFKAFWE
jgi:hypothetical protein